MDKTKAKQASSIEASAERVESLLSKCKLLFLYTFLLKSDQALTDKMQRCNFFKIPNMSLKMNPLHLKNSSQTRKQRPQKAVYSQAGVGPTCQLLRDRPLPQRSELSPDRVIRWRLKEYQLASRRLKQLQRQIEEETPKHHAITALHQQKKQEDSTQAEQQKMWQELLKAKEERQFQITRVIKYLTDI